MWRLWRPIGAIIVLTLPAGHGNLGSAQAQVVRAVLFYSPTCPHCAQTIQEDLPVFFEVYGGPPERWIDESVPERQGTFSVVSNGELEILFVDASAPRGGILYQSATATFEIPPERQGVPRLVIGDRVLVGAREIPARLHDLISQARDRGGLDWPTIPGLDEAMAGIPLATAGLVGDTTPPARTDTADRVEAAPRSGPAAARDVVPTPRRAGENPPRDSSTIAGPAAGAGRDVGGPGSKTPAVRAPDAPAESSVAAPSPFETSPTRRTSLTERLGRDLLGNGIAILVLIGMSLSIAALPTLLRRSTATPGLGLSIPLLALTGVAVAGYLTYVETSGATAVCGPVGDCNTVQQSEYAVLFGQIPVGVLGLLGYAAIIVAWVVTRAASGNRAQWAALSVLAMTVLGTLFSIYLTFLEPFVIGATCAWCVASAVIVTVLMLLCARTGSAAWARLRSTGS